MHSALRLSVISLTAAAAFAFAGQAQAGCTAIGAAGDGLSKENAKFLADHGLMNIMADKGLKPQGTTTYRCEAGAVFTTCHARQMGCK